MPRSQIASHQSLAKAANIGLGHTHAARPTQAAPACVAVHSRLTGCMGECLASAWWVGRIFEEPTLQQRQHPPRRFKLHGVLVCGMITLGKDVFTPSRPASNTRRSTRADCRPKPAWMPSPHHTVLCVWLTPFETLLCRLLPCCLPPAHTTSHAPTTTTTNPPTHPRQAHCTQPLPRPAPGA